MVASRHDIPEFQPFHIWRPQLDSFPREITRRSVVESLFIAWRQEQLENEIKDSDGQKRCLYTQISYSYEGCIISQYYAVVLNFKFSSFHFGQMSVCMTEARDVWEPWAVSSLGLSRPRNHMHNNSLERLVFGLSVLQLTQGCSRAQQLCSRQHDTINCSVVLFLTGVAQFQPCLPMTRKTPRVELLEFA